MGLLTPPRINRDLKLARQGGGQRAAADASVSGTLLQFLTHVATQSGTALGYEQSKGKRPMITFRKHAPALPLLYEQSRGKKPMIRFRTHATASTAFHVSPSGRLPRRGDAGRSSAALIILLFVASASTFATPRPGNHVGKHKAAEPSTRAQAQKTKRDAKVPVSVSRLETPDGPGIIAIIGEFPRDLDEVGEVYLAREFFQHVAAAVLGLDSTGSESQTMIEVAMLPQEKNQREGDFSLGKLKGHIVVVVEKRRVIVTCTFKVAQNPQQIAAVKALIERLTAG